jgi:DNA (cytosine-5)-methyltransferase 1
MDPPEHQYRVLDLFAGAGGLSLGFEQAGFSVAGAVEIWEPAIQTYVKNHPGSKMIGGDIRTEDVKQQVRALHGEKPIDIIIGGFPCQGFSMAGNRDPLDTRSQLYQEYLNMVMELKPAMFLMENVKGLKSMKVLPPGLPKREMDRLRKGLEKAQRYKDLKRYKAQRELTSEENDEFESLSRTLAKIKADVNSVLTPVLPIIRKSIETLGYTSYDKVLNAADYGSAQYRDRIFIVGIRNDVNTKFIFPEPTTTTPRTVQEAIGDLTDAAENPAINHDFTKHAPAFVKRIASLQHGKTLYK